MNFFKKVAILLLSVLGENFAKPLDTPERASLRKRMDQDEAASYVYRSDNNGPPQIFYLTSGDLRRSFHIPPSIPSVLSPYRGSLGPYHYSQPYAPAYPVNYYPTKAKSSLITIRPSPVDPISDEHSGSHSASSSSESNESRRHRKPQHSYESQDHSSEGGQSYEDKYLKNLGKKSKKGYKTEVKFQKAKKGTYGNEHEDGHYGQDGDKKHSQYDEADSYSAHHSGEKKAKKGKFGSKKHHKKGSKSKGYHNVFMKDEYKKDHTFYGKIFQFDLPSQFVDVSRFHFRFRYF
jgi:Domain of unknown function (DUF4779)